jgi:hypothetical protein
MRMRIVFVHAGAPRPDDGSIRSYRALGWLAERHEVHLIPVFFGDWRPQKLTLPGIPASVRLDAPLIAPMSRSLASRLLPGFDQRLESVLSQRLFDLAAGSDWLWIGWWPLARCARALRDLRAGGTALTWDWDALSLWHLTAFRALLGASPLRAVRRLVSFVSLSLFEKLYLSSLDILTVPSLREQRWLAQRLCRPVRLVRNCVELDDFATVRECPVSSAGPVALFLGSAYEPNIHGLRWLLEHVWPSVRERYAAATLRVVGRGIRSELLRTVPPGVDVVGYSPDLRPHLAGARVVLSPVFYGGGIPNKILEAAASARPCVMTPYCQSTLSNTSGLTVARSPKQWTEFTCQFLRDDAAAVAAGTTSFRAVAATFGRAQWEHDMSELEEQIVAIRNRRSARIVNGYGP